MSEVYFGSSLSLLTFGQCGSSISITGCGFVGFTLSVLDKVSLGSSLFLESFARFGTNMSAAGWGRLGGAASLLHIAAFGSSLSVRDSIRVSLDAGLLLTFLLLS
jgi:hypothetical protein